ncbi:hypothetical protein JH286_16170 [Xanthomonas campestris pv. campestris]|uniref:hypothetical protein n=1 Tax=Xanthomonas campestris TaxID=339 RepID=UPI0023677FC2|nr:hypothetical protein [Xanthomonas campestris]WDJ46371.1 hypothetical protein JH286_16170 [Xanthomonas campestris pv. campestris]
MLCLGEAKLVSDVAGRGLDVRKYSGRNDIELIQFLQDPSLVEDLDALNANLVATFLIVALMRIRTSFVKIDAVRVRAQA